MQGINVMQGSVSLKYGNSRCFWSIIATVFILQENVERRKCTECKAGTFSLQVDNPKGCTKCFCFGRSEDCEQAPYMWTEVRICSD